MQAGAGGSRVSQEAAILAWLREGRELTPLDALQQFGCFRAAARIESLRRQGHAIDTRIESRNGKACPTCQTGMKAASPMPTRKW